MLCWNTGSCWGWAVLVWTWNKVFWVILLKSEAVGVGKFTQEKTCISLLPISVGYRLMCEMRLLWTEMLNSSTLHSLQQWHSGILNAFCISIQRNHISGIPFLLHPKSISLSPIICHSNVECLQLWYSLVSGEIDPGMECYTSVFPHYTNQHKKEKSWPPQSSFDY